MSEIDIDGLISEEMTYDKAECLNGWPIADSDMPDVIGTVLQAAGPDLVAAAFRKAAELLGPVRAEMREVDGRNIRSSGLGTGIDWLLAEADKLAPPKV